MALGKIPGTNLYGQSATFGGETVWIVANQILDGSGNAISMNPNTAYRLLASLATTNGALIKAGGTNVAKVFGNNTVASKRYIKLYNKATAPTVGTDTPMLTIVVQPSVPFDFTINGLLFPLGLGIAITGAAADADATAVGAGDIECLNVLYT